MRKLFILIIVFFLAGILDMQYSKGAASPIAPFLPSGFSYLAGQYTFSDSETQRYRRIDDDLIHYTDISPLTWFDGADHVTNVLGMELRTKPMERWSYTSETASTLGLGLSKSKDYIVYVQDNMVGEYDYITVIDTKTYKLVYRRKSKDVVTATRNMGIYDGLIFLVIDGVSEVIDLETGELVCNLKRTSLGDIEEHYGLLYAKPDQIIINPKTKSVVKNYEIPGERGFYRFRDDYIEVLYCYSQPWDNYNLTKLKVTRCDKYFEPYEEFEFDVEYDIRKYALHCSYKHLAVCTNFVRSTIEIYNMTNSQKVLEMEVPKDSIKGFDIKNSKLIVGLESGLCVVDLELVALENHFAYPNKAELLTFGSNIYQKRTFLDANNNWSYELYELNYRGELIPRTRTVLGSDITRAYMIDESTAMTIRFEAEFDDDANRLQPTKGYLRFHKLGSEKHYKETEIAPIVFDGYNKYFYEDGFIYTVHPQYGVSKIDISNSSETINLCKGWIEYPTKPHMVELTLKHNEKHIIISFRSSDASWTRCFDLGNGHIEFETDQFTSNYFLFDDAITVNQTVYSISEGREYEFKGNPLYVKDGVFLYTFGDSIYLLNLETGETTNNNEQYGIYAEWVENSTYGRQFMKFYELGDYYLSNRTVLDPNGVPVQDFPFEVDSVSGGTVFSDNFANNAIATSLSPCPTFSIKRLDNPDPTKVAFELIMTRDDRQANLLEGQAYLVGWDEKPKPYQTKLEYELAAPAYHKDLGERMSIGPLIPGMTTKITLSIPDRESVLTHSDLEKLASGDNNIQQDELKYFALVIESNGLLDVANSELSNIDTKGRPLFGGEIMSLDEQRALVLTVWNIEE
ncbi:MAG TPA: hypothetical protein PKV16_06395 [Caldisericia bacterium]|nr:hypothetical protein [Caldisericia bacterium]HPF49181.1 hypothetical protein [Caldisericia bacterium]HPI84140.1 hypothetical protein [Caldisericia bacterium]HPQ93397.1 hypothetical protein [Caldisericia bacterium]HRV75221.1 hypothetical protein [Caldisericia bacterium]